MTNKKLTIDIDEVLHQKLSVVSALRGISMKDIVVTALEKELDEDRDKKNLEKLWGKKK
jgi:predicted HicB family RNase H-like nuclease